MSPQSNGSLVTRWAQKTIINGVITDKLNDNKWPYKCVTRVITPLNGVIVELVGVHLRDSKFCLFFFPEKQLRLVKRLVVNLT